MSDEETKTSGETRESPEETTKETVGEETETPKRTQRGLLDGLLRGPAVVVLGALLLVQVNYLSARHYNRWDWTHDAIFTLSSRSAQIARGLRAPTKLYVLLARDEPLYNDVSELAERYSAASAKVEVIYIDPDRQRERLVGLAQEINLQLVGSRDGERTLSSAGIVVRRGQRHWEVQREQLRELGAPSQGEDDTASRVLNAKITVERAISEALLQVDREHATKVCFATGHAEAPISSGDRAGAGLVEDLRHLNFETREVEVRGQTGIASDCDALLIVGPQRAYPREDAAAVERYLRAGGNVAIFADPVVLEGRVVSTGLESVAALGGISLPPAIVVEGDSSHLVADAPPVNFRADTWNEHDITRDLRGSSVLISMARPVVRSTGATTVPATLLETTTSAWGETDITELMRTFTPSKGNTDVQGPVPVAMATTVSDARPRGEGTASGRLVVLGSSELAASTYFQLQVRAQVANANLTEAVVGWLTARRELVNIPARPVSRASLLVSERDLTWIGLYVILLIPLAAALVGVAVWRTRKAS